MTNADQKKRDDNFKLQVLSDYDSSGISKVWVLVKQNVMISPLSLQTKCSLKP